MTTKAKKAKMSLGPWTPRSEETLGEYLKRLRIHKAALTTTDVDQATCRFPPQMRVSHSYLSQLEHGYIRHPSGDRLRVLADLYEVPQRSVLEKAGFPYQVEESFPFPEKIPKEVWRVALRVYQLGPTSLKAVLRVIEALEEAQRQAGRKGSQ